MTLAAGPDRIVSTGRCLAMRASINAPSPRTTINGASMPRSAMVASTDSIKACRNGIRRALRATVVARPMELRREVNSWPQVVGRPASSTTMSRTVCS